jgi:hypothetical protein
MTRERPLVVERLVSDDRFRQKSVPDEILCPAVLDVLEIFLRLLSIIEITLRI